MKCKNCGAETENAKFCAYCGKSLEGAEVLAVQILRAYTLTGRGFMVNGVAQMKIGANDVLKNNRTKKSFAINYIVNSKFKMVKEAEEGKEYTFCLSGASAGDFEGGDNLIV